MSQGNFQADSLHHQLLSGTFPPSARYVVEHNAIDLRIVTCTSFFLHLLYTWEWNELESMTHCSWIVNEEGWLHPFLLGIVKNILGKRKLTHIFLG